MKKKLLVAGLALVFIVMAAGAAIVISINASLPRLVTLEDYQPLLVSEVFDRNGTKVGEFSREKRRIVPMEKIPKVLINAFLAAEDASFFEHGGINYLAILRAILADVRAGGKVQGGSTITQQVARSLMLTSEKTLDRKVREVILSYRMEKNLSKNDILYLYLNQIYLGQGAYGVAVASEIYFQKPLDQITLAEAALLAGMTQAPSRYSPHKKPKLAKNRQLYVLRRMEEVGYITKDQEEAAAKEPLKVQGRKNYMELAPHFLETVRLLLEEKIGQEAVFDKGLQIHVSMDLQKQLEAQKQLAVGLRMLDKRQGYRGPIKKITEAEKVAEFLLTERNDLMDDAQPFTIIMPDGTIPDRGPLNLEKKEGATILPSYLAENQIVKGIVTQVDDKWGLVTVRFAEQRGLIDLETMKWARKPNPEISSDYAHIVKPSQALEKGDVVQIRIAGKNFNSSRLDKLLTDERRKLGKKYQKPQDLPQFDEYVNVELEQEPIVQGAVFSIDQKNQDILTLVGGSGDFTKSQFNRALQARRQTGSAFKAFIYGAALEKGYKPNTPIVDAPIVYEEQLVEGQDAVNPGETADTKKWKPLNHSKRFTGDVLFRTALTRSLNVPTVKIVEKIGVDWSMKFARRLGIFSPLNNDFTIALGSSGVTLYEMTRAFSEIGRMGQVTTPILVHKVLDPAGHVLAENLTLDERFNAQMKEFKEKFEEDRKNFLEKKAKISGEAHPTANGPNGLTPPAAGAPGSGVQAGIDSPFYFDDPNQLIRPTTAYILTQLLQGVIEDPEATGGAARSLGRPVAGKTGTTSSYVDAWFVGFTPDICSGVWVGYDQEKTLGRGEVGGKAALPIWLEFMKSAHKDLPSRSFVAPEGIIFANIDAETGKLASTQSKRVIRQAFVEGTEPTEVSTGATGEDKQDFYKEDLTE